MTHDLSFRSGERQTASAYEMVRADHRFRYEWADALIPPGGYGLDAFCGNGYGAWLLSRTRHVLALDGSAEAVAFAFAHFATPRARFAQAYWPFELPPAAFDFAVSLESVEHVPDGEAFLGALAQSLKPRGLLVFSTPNEDHLPHAGSGNKFHFQHYSLAESRQLAAAAGLEVVRWAGQDAYLLTQDGRPTGLRPDGEMALRDDVAGQFVILACRKPASTPATAGAVPRIPSTEPA